VALAASNREHLFPFQVASTLSKGSAAPSHCERNATF
jgi:hypothetical protein